MYPVKQYLDICIFLYIQATPLSLQWMKNFSLHCKAAILSLTKAINKHVCWDCKSDGAVNAEPGTTEYVNTTFYHNYLAVNSI